MTSNSKQKSPSLGVAIIITHGERLLVGRRKNPPMAQSWQLPGGWLHYQESPLQAVQRLQHQFPGMHCGRAGLVSHTSNLFEDGTHSVSLYFQMQCLNADDVDLQRNQDCSDWMWVDWYDLPKPLFLPLQLLKQSSYSPFIRDL
jgi:8-oxo-dGTP diphosphatase